MSWKKFLVLGIAGALAVFAMPGMSLALSFDVQFQNITNSTTDIADQFLLTIMDYEGANAKYSSLSLSDDQVLFVFSNNVGTASSITEIYVDDGTILGLSSIKNFSGTDFTTLGLDPPDLPGGNTLTTPFDATSAFSVDVVKNTADGINTSTDLLGIIYQLEGDNLYADVLDALYTGDLRIGLHVRAIGSDDKSDSFVSHVPDASIMFLLGPGLIVLGIIGRKKRR